MLSPIESKNLVMIMIVSNSGYSVVSAVVAAVVVVGAGAYQRVLGRLGVEVVGPGRDHRGGVEGDGGPRRCGRLKPIDGGGDVVGEGVGGAVPDTVAVMSVDAAGCGGRDEADDGELEDQIDDLLGIALVFMPISFVFRPI